eukprot:CAMPEP_0113601454 /NCGR_PEP_ID=MMETSP0017_2-20120614/237_1 /TAXON_ID=2856 /ORGANISM="Cylindrotheca closterium" /LENGTH=516 /DNA_ID=CAMNT_0000509747 /DNA_START=91 /DNA_END=1641 /DNA_ORIENTATION=+ /assembly_acc=CAM_ASM_000147
MASFLSMGRDTYKIPLAMFRENRIKLAKSIKSMMDESALIVLIGGPSTTRFDSDNEPVFRQESYFWWVSGVKDPDCALILDEDGKMTLLVPNLPEDYATIMGHIKSLEEWKELYGADDVGFTEDLEQILESRVVANNKATKILLMEGPNTDSGKTYDLAPDFKSSKLVELQDKTSLFPILAECRVHKSKLELALLEHVSQISSFAHSYVMRHLKPGMMEYQAESLFMHYSYFNFGSRLVSYTSICGCGPNAAILHYGHAGEPNARLIGEEDNCLFDMGAEYQCYASDITCSFPANGKFSAKYLPIYNAVLQAQITVYEMCKPGVSWVDCHKAAEKTILEALAEIGIVNKGPDVSFDDLVELRLGGIFMPHGLGHFIGIDTHDVGGYLPGHQPRIQLPGLSKLRTARLLEENMVLTVEPGCYFSDHLLDGALRNPALSKYLNEEKLKPYRGYGGVRLEDVVTITKDGCVNFTVCPRTVEEVEGVMAGGKWPPMKDSAPELRRVNLIQAMPMLGPLGT